MPNRILVICAHHDDEVLGCGATIKKLTASGHEVGVLILGEGTTARATTTRMELERLKNNHLQALEVLGAKSIECDVPIRKTDLGHFTNTLPDNRFDTVPLLKIVQMVERVIDEFKPNTIYSHTTHDLNIDHRITAQAVLTATRPLPGQTVKELYAFEVMSSTEYSFNQFELFRANTYVDVTEHFKSKLDAIRCYEDELRAFPHPRSLQALEAWGAVRGSQVGVEYGEAFELIRAIK